MRETQVRPRRLGMLIPSSNTVLEPETARLLPTDGSVTSHVSRISVVNIAADDASLGQFETEAFIAAAGLLHDADVDLILWNGTAASWLGFAWDARIVAAIEAHTGIPTTTAVLAINARLAKLEAKRIGLVTPYVAALEDKITANYASIGVEVVSAERLDLTRNTDYADIAPSRIGDMVRTVARARPDAIVVMCTNLAGASVAEPLGIALSIPVIDSVRVAVEHSCALLLAPRPDRGAGANGVA